MSQSPTASVAAAVPANVRKTGWMNAATSLILVPVKQHAVCCGLVPMAAAVMGSSAAVEWL
ncbi:MAG: hypothetical protein JWM96_611, partial [Alphaproteobacteria bacterium]|nr:hypothetical protein [Alphaproteobacteria bacterium]